MGRSLHRLYPLVTLCIGALTLLPLTPAAAHEEREVVMPAGTGTVPAYRTSGTTLLVCGTDQADFDKRIATFSDELRAANVALWTQCQASGHRTVAAAIAAAAPGSIVKVLPGVYLEEPSLSVSSALCAHLPARRAGAGYEILTWEQQLACPTNQNLVPVLGKSNLQIEGTGAGPGDVVIDAQYRKLNAIRADRANGIYLRNFTVQHTVGSAIFVMETDGFAIDNVLTRWNDESGVSAYASDHGLILDCEAYGNGAAGIDITSSQDVNSGAADNVSRWAVEVQHCRSHGNLIGLAGAAADSIWVHDNEFTQNTAGVVLDGAAGRPGQPQNHARLENNAIGANNQDYDRYAHDGTCAKPTAQRGYEQGVVCPIRTLPAGIGVVSLGGDRNLFIGNWVFDNATAGFVTGWAPGWLRGDKGPGAQFDTAHHNRYVDNRLGVRPDGRTAPNGLDFWWDGQGVGSCWQAPTAGSIPARLPLCRLDGDPQRSTYRLLPDPALALTAHACLDGGGGCPWSGASGLARVDVRYAVGEALVIGLLALLVWLRMLRRRGARLAGFGLVVTIAGLGLGVYGTLVPTRPWTAIGLAVLGVGLLALGWPMKRRGRPLLRVVTYLVAFSALLGAIDRTLWLLPIIPAAPAFLRLVFELVWIPWAIVALFGGPIVAGAASPETREIRSDPLVRFAAALRAPRAPRRRRPHLRRS
jgi:hypothetical protein